MKDLPQLPRDQRQIDAGHLKLLMIFHFVAAGLSVLGLLFLLGQFKKYEGTPPFQDIMLPLLRLAGQANGKPLAIREAVKTLADEMNLSENDRTELLPSGRQSRFANRVAWSASHLRRANLQTTTAVVEWRTNDTMQQRGIS